MSEDCCIDETRDSGAIDAFIFAVSSEKGVDNQDDADNVSCPSPFFRHVKEVDKYEHAHTDINQNHEDREDDAQRFGGCGAGAGFFVVAVHLLAVAGEFVAIINCFFHVGVFIVTLAWVGETSVMSVIVGRSRYHCKKYQRS